MIKLLEKNIVELTEPEEFNEYAVQIFHYQAAHNEVYRQYLHALKINPEAVSAVGDIPFLPIRFFKTHHVTCGSWTEAAVFSSSGTSGVATSRHFVKDIELYKRSFFYAFQHFYGDIKEYTLLALLPSYLERSGSSLVFMVKELIGLTQGGFYLNNLEELRQRLIQLEAERKKTLLIGVTFALLDFAEKFPMKLAHTIVMETGGMKGRREELTREEVHEKLKQSFGLAQIHSEYGMTELMSQAYSTGSGIFRCPPWMRVVTREITDPLALVKPGVTGGINVIDLANLYSCAFIATDDLGRLHSDGAFEVLGRYDQSVVRGCNLLVV